MRKFLPMLTLLASGCATAPIDSAICAATAQDRTRLAAALADDPTDAAVIAGQALIARLDAGCAD